MHTCTHTQEDARKEEAKPRHWDLQKEIFPLANPSEIKLHTVTRTNGTSRPTSAALSSISTVCMPL